MSILRAKTQMLKHKDRLIAKITDTEKKRDELALVIKATEAQIESIDAAMVTLDAGIIV